jgi:hypothetical protein
MSNVVKFSINGDTNADQVTDKVKKSVSTLEKNLKGIEDRFKNFGKDLFLSLAAPMVILNKVINDVEASMAKSRENARKGLEDIASGENKMASEREVRLARFIKANTEKREYEEQTQAGRAEAAGRFIDENQMDFLLNKPVSFFASLMGEMGIGKGFGYKFVQEAAMERFEANNPVDPNDPNSPEKLAQAAKKQKEATEAQTAAQKEVDKMPTTFKGPEGFSNVVGVGANPVLEAMASQLEEAKKTNDLLAQLVTPSRTNSWLDAPAGATSTAAPSRAAMLKGK